MNFFKESTFTKRLEGAIEYCDSRYCNVKMVQKSEGFSVQFPIRKLMSEMEMGIKTYEEGVALMRFELARMSAKIVGGRLYGENKVPVWQEFRQYMELAIKSSANFKELYAFYETFLSYIA